MTLSFDTFDWIIGLTFLGGVGLMVLIACVLRDRPFIGLAVVLLGIAFSIAAAAGIDLFLQSFTTREFWAGGTHKRHAMRSFMPFILGMTVGMGASGLLVGWITAGYRGEKDMSDLMNAALKIRRTRQAALHAPNGGNEASH